VARAGDDDVAVVFVGNLGLVFNVDGRVGMVGVANVADDHGRLYGRVNDAVRDLEVALRDFLVVQMARQGDVLDAGVEEHGLELVQSRFGQSLIHLVAQADEALATKFAHDVDVDRRAGHRRRGSR